MIVALEGLLAGAAHVLTGPDHLVGVAPLAVDRRATIRPALVGATWGLGHGLGVAALGALGQSLLSIGQVEVASVWAERLVGLVLIVLGVQAIAKAKGLVVHQHVHEHDGEPHVHLHVHDHGDDPHHVHEHAVAADATHCATPHRHHHAAFGIGVVHGLAGAGHFWAVLPSLAMPAPTAALYIGSYLAATMVAMTLFGWAVGRFAAAFAAERLPAMLRAVGGITVAIGVFWLGVAFELI